MRGGQSRLHSAKTKAHRGREIDVLIFPFSTEGAGSEEKEDVEAEKTCSLLFRLLFFVRGEKPVPGPQQRGSCRGSRAAEVRVAGRRLCERRGYYCNKFHHEEGNGRESLGEKGGEASCAPLFQLLRVLFQGPVLVVHTCR